MNKRFFLKSLLGLTGLSATQNVLGKLIPQKIGAVEITTKAERVLIQESPLAGFQYYQAEETWKKMRPGDVLEFLHEKDNRYDRNAVAVRWESRMIGYLPRKENAAISQMLDRGLILQGRISSLKQSSNPWERIGVEVFLNPQNSQESSGLSPTMPIEGDRYYGGQLT